MKKNNMLRLASVLLVAVLLSTCALSGVFAYYMTSNDTSDDARVAKWGVVINFDDVDMFQTTYEEGNETVVSSTTEDVVAPGTAGDLTGISITGKPEVDVTVTQKADLTLTGWTLANGDEYCPIVIVVNDVEYKMESTVAAFEKAVEEAIADKSATYETNTDLSEVKDDVVVSWYWDFGSKYINDTYLGDQAAAGNAATIKLAITTTITQID